MLLYPYLGLENKNSEALEDGAHKRLSNIRCEELGLTNRSSEVRTTDNALIRDNPTCHLQYVREHLERSVTLR